MNKPIPNALYRQGDVALQRIQALPTGLIAARPENGRVVLAHGVSTGHNHAFLSSEVQKFTDAKGAEFFAVRIPLARRKDFREKR